MILYNRDCHIGYAVRLLVVVVGHPYIPSTGRGGLGLSSQAPTGSIGIAYEDKDENNEEVDQRHEELGPSQLQDAPSTQPTQPVGTRRRHSPDSYTPGTNALSHKGKGKTRRQ